MPYLNSAGSGAPSCPVTPACQRHRQTPPPVMHCRSSPCHPLSRHSALSHDSCCRMARIAHQCHSNTSTEPSVKLALVKRTLSSLPVCAGRHRHLRPQSLRTRATLRRGAFSRSCRHSHDRPLAAAPQESTLAEAAQACAAAPFLSRGAGSTSMPHRQPCGTPCA